VTAKRWRSRVRGVLTDPDGRVLVLESSGPSLPAVEIDGDADNELEAVRRAFGELIGAPVAILRTLACSVERESKVLDVVYELERLDAAWEFPAGAVWLDHGALDDELRDLVPQPAHIPAQRAPWAQEGWPAEATAWSAARSAYGRPVTTTSTHRGTSRHSASRSRASASGSALKSSRVTPPPA